MKYYKESIIALLALIILYSGPNMITNVIHTPLGRLLAIVLLIVLANTYGKKYSIFYALIIIMLLHNVFEGMENKDDNDGENEKEDNNEETEETEENNETKENNDEENNEEENKELTNTSGKDQIDNEERLKNVVPSDAPQNEGNNKKDDVEGFSNYNGIGIFAGY